MTGFAIDREEMEKTKAVMQLLYSRIKEIDCINYENYESISYRVAEIMSAAKNLYTDMLPRMLDEKSEQAIWEQLVEMRMHFLHLSDLLGEFEELFMSSIEAKDEEEGG